MIGPRGTPLVFFFNRKLTEGPMPILLQSAGTETKQKKCRDKCQNMVKLQGLMTHLNQNWMGEKLFNSRYYVDNSK